MYKVYTVYHVAVYGKIFRWNSMALTLAMAVKSFNTSLHKRRFFLCRNTARYGGVYYIEAFRAFKSFYIESFALVQSFLPIFVLIESFLSCRQNKNFPESLKLTWKTFRVIRTLKSALFGTGARYLLEIIKDFPLYRVLVQRSALKVNFKLR